MVFNGFTDENGNVIPVQGAGTVYNEEKNSLALGKETVAIGQDQLVFGRLNVEDTENSKVEIVGGGSMASHDGFHVGDKATVSITRGNPNKPVEKVLHIEYRGLRSSGVDGYGMLTYIPSDLTPEEEAEMRQTYEATFGKDYYTIKHVWKVTGESSITHFLGPDNALDDQGGSEAWTWKTGAGGDGCFTKGAEIEQTEEKKNIRTLDWEGNEKLAGGLTVGTGITIGGTSLSETELIALKALLNS